MPTEVVKYRIRTLYATAATLAAANPVLLEGEPATESDTGVKKIGDGVTAYNDLPAESGGGGGGGSPTNLSIANRGATTLDVASSTGADATIPAATTSLTGLLTATDKTKLDGIAAGAELNVNADWNAASGDAQILNKPTLGTAASQNVGTGAGNVVQLDGSARLPAVDGSQLTNLPGGGGAVSISGTPSAGQTAEWASGTAIAGVGVTGTGSYVKGTNPLLSQVRFNLSAAVTAGTNAQGQGALTEDVNVVTTAANNPSGVTLPTASAERVVTIFNRGANNINVYPASGGTIDSRAINTADLIRVGHSRTYYGSSSTQWFSSAEQTALTTIAGFGTGVAAALAINTGSAGAPVLFNGAGGTPTSLTLTNATGLPAAGVTGLGSLATLSALGNITSAGAIGSTANIPIITGTGGVLQAGSFGSTANTFCQGNDSRLSDARTPTAHNQAWSTITSTPTTLSGYGITDGQPLDADLTSIAALTTTTYGRSQLTLADAAADTAQLNVFSSSLKGLAPASGGGTSNFLRADGTWAAPGGGGATNLSYDAATRVIASDTGTDATVPLVSSTEAGLAPASGGGTSNFLRADGTWQTPAGGGNVSNAGTPASGQAAEWTSATTVQGVAVTGTGNYAKATNPALSAFTVTNNVTITAGTNAQGQAPLTADVNVITTAAANPSGVTLPVPPSTGTRMVMVVNRGANPVNVFPSTGVTINALAANAAIALPVGASMEFYSETATAWETNTISLSSGVTGVLPAVNVATLNQSTTGSAATLTTTRTIGGSNFNGSANVTSFPAPGAIGGTTPSTGVFTTLVANAATSLLLGTAGTAVGSVGFRNATSGTITLAPPTGALGTVTLTLPAITDTLVSLTATQTLTNKTLTSPTMTTPALGTPASGVLTSCTGLPPGGLTMATARILGRTTAGSGVAEEISIGSGLSMTAGVLSATGGGGYADDNYAIPANVLLPQATGPALATITTTTNGIKVGVADFDGVAVEVANFTDARPKNWSGANPTAKFLWQPAASGSGAVVWGIAITALNEGDVVDVAPTWTEVTDSVVTAERDQITAATAAISIQGTVTADSRLQFWVRRNPAAGGDTMTQDARLVAVVLTFALS